MMSEVAADAAPEELPATPNGLFMPGGRVKPCPYAIAELLNSPQSKHQSVSLLLFKINLNSELIMFCLILLKRQLIMRKHI